jgi:predicted phosphodiesterase
MSDRSIIIGDVHGCVAELEFLLKHLDVGPADEVIFVGDLINKGPDSHGVVSIAREIKARSVLGNHERRLLHFHRTGETTYLKEGDLPTIAALTVSDWLYLERMPLTISLPERNAIVAHGGFLPGIPPRQQSEEVVTRIQVIDANGQPAKRSQAPDAKPWADFWTGPEFVLYGHTPRRSVFRRPYSIGLDTGCVYGGRLTAYIYPQKVLCQVRAKTAYVKKNL